MIRRIKRSAVWISAISLMAGMMAIVAVAPANATANASTRLVDVTGDLGNAPVSDASTAGGVAQYYNAQIGWKDAFVTAGETFTLVFEVRAAGGALATAGDQVTLYANTSYSGSLGAITETGSNTVVSAASNGSDGGSFVGIVDAQGRVSFTFHNTNVDADVLAAPSNVNTAKTSDGLGNGSIFSNFILKYDDGISTLRTGGADTQDADIVSIHFVKSSQGGGGLPSIRLLNPSITVGTNASDYTSDISQYYSAGTKSYQTFSQDTQTVTLTYQVTTDGTTPAGSGTVVKLYGNSAWSGSNANWTINGTAIVPANNGTPGGSVTQTTNSSGQVSFTIVNTDTTGFEPAPASLHAGRPGSGRLYGTFKPVIVSGGSDTGDMAEDTDLITFDVYQVTSGGGGGGSVTQNARITLSSSDASSMTDKSAAWWRENSSSHSYVKMVIAGSTLTLHYHVTDETGTAISGATVTLAKSTTNGGDFSGSLTGTTDSSGDVVFTLTNTNTNAQSEPYPEAPSSINYWDDTRGYIFSSQATEIKVDLVPSVTGYNAIARDRVWTHIVAAQGAESNKKREAIVALEDNPNYFVVEKAPEAKQTASLDAAAGTFTCNNATSKLTPTLAVYYLIVDNRPTAGLRFGKFEVTRPLYPSINAVADGSATATSATFKLDKSWNANGHSARLQCVIQTGASLNTVVLKTPVTLLKGVGKYKKPTPIKVWTPKKVTMRLVEPVMTKDASGRPVDYVDMSASPVQDHWSQYYGSSDGGLGVFYKYLEVGSTTTFKYKVTDSETKQPVPFFKVWLVVNKNYGGVENATFTYENNGVVYKAAGHSGEFGESQFEGLTDANGYVSFTLVNTNTASEAEPKPVALNQEQPKSVTTSCFSTITLMAHLGSDETMETKDFIWAHIVQK